MMTLKIIALLSLSFLLGAAPLPEWIFKRITGLDLKTKGTGNISVAAAFIQGGSLAGLSVVILEISRGLLPGILAKYLGLPPAWQLGGLIPLVLSRYGCSQGGGVTNVTWGIWLYSPPLVLAAGFTGLLSWGITRSRLWGARLGCGSAVLWLALSRASSSEVVAAFSLASLLIIINMIQMDDQVYMRVFQPLQTALDPHQVGAKAARLAQLKQAGFQVPDGYVFSPFLNPVKDLDRLLQRLQPQPSEQQIWIVRSSALGEDADSSSSAGHYQSVGQITSRELLKKAIQACLDSYQSPQAVAYRQQRQIPEAQMAVLIQKRIQGQVSGVAFSRNPLNGNAQVILEALPGGAAAVVSGQQTPTHLEIDLNSQLDSVPTSTVIPPDVLRLLITQVQQIETHFHGIPQDIEWTWDGERLWILQSRPITNLRPIWTRTIAAEVIPGAIRPLTWSINRPLTCGVWGTLFTLVLDQAVKDLDFNQTATLFASHAYFNATLLGAIFRQMGLPEQGLEFLLRQQKMGKPPRSAYRQLFKCLGGLWRLIQQERKLPQTFEQDQRSQFQPALQILDQQALDLLTTSELLALAEQIQDLLRLITFYNIVGPIGLGIRRSLFKVTDTWLQDQTSSESQALTSLQTLAKSLKDHLDPELSLDQQRLALQSLLTTEPIATSFDAILKQYGFLSQVGTDIAVPCWREQSDLIRQSVINLALQPEIPTAPAKETLNWWQQWRAQQCQRRLDLKGSIATVYAKLLAHLRWTFVELEQRWIKTGLLQQSGDIFFLEFEQVQELGQLDPSERQGLAPQLQLTVTHRRTQWEQDQDRVVPTVVYGSVLPEETAISIDPSETCLVGIPASIGETEGIVRVVKQLDLNSWPDPNDPVVLVVPYTDAGWVPFLAGAKAIVAEVGGQLSHGAIMAREYGIPAVMNVNQATHKLKDGQRVRVNGYQGWVEIMGHPDTSTVP